MIPTSNKQRHNCCFMKINNMSALKIGDKMRLNIWATSILLIFSLQVIAQKPNLIIPSFHSASINEIDITSDGKLMLTGGMDNVIKIWDYNKGKEIKSIPVSDDVKDINISGNDKYAVVSDKKFIYLIDLVDIRLIRKIKFPKTTNTVDISNDGQRIYYGYIYDKVAKIFKCDVYGNNCQTLSERTISGFNYITKIDVSPNEKYMLIEERDDNFIMDLNNPASLNPVENAQFFLPNNWYIKLTSSSFSAIDPITNTTKWTKSYTGVSGDGYTKKRFFVDKAGEHISLSVTNGSNEVVYYGNYISGSFQEKRNFLTPNAKSITQIAKKENDFLMLTYEPIAFKVLNANSLKTKKSFGESLMMSRQLDGRRDAFSFSFGGLFNDRVKKVDFKDNQLMIEPLKTNGGMNHIRVSANGDITAVTNELAITKNVKVFKGDQLIYTSPTYKLEDKFLDFGLSKDGRYLAILFKEKLIVTNLQTKNNAFTKTFSGMFKQYARGKLIMSNDKLVMAYEPKDASSYTWAYKCFDINSRTEMWTQTNKYTALNFLSDDNLIALKDYRQIVRLNAASGSETVISSLSEKLPYSTDFSYSQDFSKLAIHDDLDILVYDVKTGRKLTILKGATSNIWRLEFYNNEFLISSGDDVPIRLWDVKNSQELAQLIFYERSNDWVIVTPDGLFDGTDHAIQQMYFTQGKTIIPLDQLYEQFYTPNLLSQLISREIEPTPLEIDEINPPPSITIEYNSGQRNLIVVDDEPTEEIISTDKEEAIIKLTANAPNDVVDEIRLYHNGKSVGGTSRGLFVEDDNPSEKEQTFTVKLLPGENTFKAIALNNQRTESAPALIKVKYTPKATIEQPVTVSTGMTLHLIVVGINKYKNPRYNLNYAQADANAFKETIANGMKNITSKENIHFVSDADADKSGILAAIQTVQKTANSQDVFVFYYAGHGVMSEGYGDKKKDFYIVPHDVTQLYGNDDGLAQKGISATEMKELASSIKAQKQLFVLDACQSAGAVESIAMRGAAEEKAIAQLARSTGTHWLTASGSEQFATEFAELGHGVFTYALLQGLQGKADSGDKKVTINELKAFIESQVPELTQQYKGTPQYPASYGYGQDFPVSIVK